MLARVLTAVALMVVASTSPIAANPPQDTGIAKATGTGVICASSVPGKAQAANCPMTPAHDQGLYGVGQWGGPTFFGFRSNPFDKSKYMGRYGRFAFSSGAIVLGVPICVYNGALGANKNCTLFVEGFITPVQGIGAACGVFSGFGGTGDLDLVNGTQYDITNFGWPTSVGGTLVVQGKYVRTVTGAGKSGAAGKTGELSGFLQLQGGASCFKTPASGSSGASQFNWTGSITLT